MTRRLLFFALGILFGAAVGSALAMLLTPTSGNDLRKRAKNHVRRAMKEAQRAAEARRIEMERQLDALTTPKPKSNK
jgi:gas vesicle protein